MELVAQGLLAVPVELAHDLGTGKRNEVGIDLVCDRFCDQGLTGARGTVEQDTLGGFDPQFFKDLRVAQRELDHFPDELELAFEPTDILVLDIGNLPFALFGIEGFLFEFDLRIIGDDSNGPRGNPYDDKRDRVADDIDAQHLPFYDRPTAQDPR